MTILYPQEVYTIQGAIFEVYKEMGCGFLEAVYEECLHREFTTQNIPHQTQVSLPLQYKGEPLDKTYRVDFICYNKILIELKAVKTIQPEHKAQILNYLKATGFQLGLLVNFGSHPKVEIHRFINTTTTKTET